MRRLLFLTAAIFLVSTSAWAQTPAISTDRPSFSAAAAVVPQGKVQLEAGLALEVDPDVAAALPLLLFRANVAKSLEIRLGLPNLVLGGKNTFLGNTAIEIKFADAVSDTLSMGAMPYIHLPTSNNDLFGPATLGTRILADVSLTKTLGLTANVDLAITKRGGSRQLRFASSLLLGWAFVPQWNAFVETFNIYQPSFSDVELGFTGGVTYAMNRSMQLDFSVVGTIGNVLPDAVFNIGFSVMGP